MYKAPVVGRSFVLEIGRPVWLEHEQVKLEGEVIYNRCATLFDERMNELVSEQSCCSGLENLSFSRDAHLCSTSACSNNLVLDILGGCPLSWQRLPSELYPLTWYQRRAGSSGLYTQLTLSALSTLRAPPFLPFWLPQGINAHVYEN